MEWISHSEKTHLPLHLLSNQSSVSFSTTLYITNTGLLKLDVAKYSNKKEEEENKTKTNKQTKPKTEEEEGEHTHTHTHTEKKQQNFF